MASSDIGCPLCAGAMDTVATAVGLWIAVSLDLAGGRFLIFLLMFAVPFYVLKHGGYKPQTRKAHRDRSDGAKLNGHRLVARLGV